MTTAPDPAVLMLTLDFGTSKTTNVVGLADDRAPMNESTLVLTRDELWQRGGST